MRVLQINAVYDVGSTGVITRDIHELCLKKGIDSYVAYSTSPRHRKDIANGYKIGTMFGKKLHALLCRVNGQQAYFSRIATRNLIRYIRKIKPDVVHLHNLHSNYLHLNMLLSFLEKEDVSTVITLHDCWFYTGGCFHYTNAGCDKWLKECGICPKKKQDTPAYLFDRSKKILADRKKYLCNIKKLTVVGVSQWITNEARRTFLEQKNCVTVYNGIDMDFYRPMASELRAQLGLSDKFVVLGMANKWLQPVNKEALNVVAKALGDDCVIVLVGCNDRHRASLPQNVLAMDYIRDRDLMRKVYSMADVFVNCTREDSLSLVNVEAQACGTPIITYRNTGAKETVDEQSGFTVETGNVRELVEKIRYVKGVGKSYLTEQCRQYVKNKFERDQNYNQIIDLYKKLYDKI